MRPDGVCGSALRLLAGVLALAIVGPAIAWGQPTPPASRLERERQQLLRQLDLRNRPPRAPAAPIIAPDPPAALAPTPASGEGATPLTPPSAARPPVAFSGRVHDILLGSCRSCHIAGGSAANTKLVLDGDTVRDHAVVRRLIDLRAPRRSLLLSKATGEAHGGAVAMASDSDGYRRVLGWIATGAVREDLKVSPAAGVAMSGPRLRPRVSIAASAPLAGSLPAETPAAPPPKIGAPDESRDGVALRLNSELVRACATCHGSGGVAAQTKYFLSGDPAGNLIATRLFIDTKNPNASPALRKAAGHEHGGGVIWTADAAGAAHLLDWIAAGAPDIVASETLVVPAVPAPADVPRSPGAPSPGGEPPAKASPAPPPAGHLGPHGLALGADLRLNGRFDLNLERRSFNANPVSSGGDTALQSYHHFLFLSRGSLDDPFTLDVELVNLEFFEVGARLLGPHAPIRLHIKVGKILVPFGTEPLYHQSYGGHAGFDQKVLPAIWASEGLSLSARRQIRGLSLTLDGFTVRGHTLRTPDGILNLRADRAPADNVRLGTGLRLGFAWGPWGGFYSTYWNPLGGGRHLFMQALDVGVWRWRGIPLLDRLVVGLGLLRADVSGGGGGRDYYHFASYAQARIYALDALYLQYRQGLRTFDNRRGLAQDPRRFGTHDGLVDGSTHNLGLFARHRGLQVGLVYFLNFEKTAETPNDVLRLMVAYEF